MHDKPPARPIEDRGGVAPVIPSRPVPRPRCDCDNDERLHGLGRSAIQQRIDGQVNNPRRAMQFHN